MSLVKKKQKNYCGFQRIYKNDISIGSYMLCPCDMKALTDVIKDKYSRCRFV